MNKPLVSIITITYNLIDNNRKEHFHKCLDSITAQTYENIEHIIVDGGSNDGTLDLIKEYAQKHPVKYVSEPDDGIYYAMNKGIDMASGKYIAFMNSDDSYYSNDAIEASVKKLEKTNADFSYGKVNYIDENDKLITQEDYPDLRNSFLSMPAAHETIFIKSDIIKKFKFDTTYKSSADYDLILKIMLNNCKSTYVDKIIFTFRLGGMSTMDENQKMIIDEMTEIYYKNYKPLTNDLTKEECEFVAKNKALPEKIYNALQKTGYNSFKEFTAIKKQCPYPFFYSAKTKRIKTTYLLGIPIISRYKDDEMKKVRFCGLKIYEKRRTTC